MIYQMKEETSSFAQTPAWPLTPMENGSTNSLKMTKFHTFENLYAYYNPAVVHAVFLNPPVWKGYRQILCIDLKFNERDDNKVYIGTTPWVAGILIQML